MKPELLNDPYVTATQSESSMSSPLPDTELSRSERTDHRNDVKRKLNRRSNIIAVVSFLAIYLLYVIITSCLIQPFQIPSESMENTLHIGDRILVNRTVSKSDIKRGDVVVFAPPASWGVEPEKKSGLSGALSDLAADLKIRDSGEHLVKRVIGLGGDHVSCVAHQPIKINGVSINETYLKTGTVLCDVPFSIVVPKGKIWVMGDNRNFSSDSRYHDNGTGTLGSVPLGNVVGTCSSIAYPFNRIGSCGSNTKPFDAVAKK